MDVALDFEGIMKIGNKRKLKIFACFAILKRPKLHLDLSHIILGGIAMSRELKAVAEYILWFAGESGSLITNLKLQKLVYYAQAWHLALHDEPLFNNPIEAWVHGPAVRRLYADYAEYGYGDLPVPDKKPSLSPEVESFLDELLDVFLPFDAYALQRMTHNEDPWIEARGDLPNTEPSSNYLSPDTMKQFYRSLASSQASDAGQA